jgi:hypothetical protein
MSDINSPNVRWAISWISSQAEKDPALPFQLRPIIPYLYSSGVRARTPSHKLEKLDLDKISVMEKLKNLCEKRHIVNRHLLSSLFKLVIGNIPAESARRLILNMKATSNFASRPSRFAITFPKN